MTANETSNSKAVDGGNGGRTKCLGMDNLFNTLNINNTCYNTDILSEQEFLHTF